MASACNKGEETDAGSSLDAQWPASLACMVREERERERKRRKGEDRRTERREGEERGGKEGGGEGGSSCSVLLRIL